jgi:predicted glycosyltransferase
MIPTPGQTEQEYLGKRLSKLGWFTVQAQQNLDLSNAIQQCIDSQYKIPALNFDAYRKTIDQFGIQYFGA